MRNKADKNNQPAQNLLLVALQIVIILFTAYHEGYLPLISPLFWASLITGFIICGWLAFIVSTRRLLSLLLAIFVIEYIKETIGLRSKLWTYNGLNGFYNFGVWAWVLGGLIAYCLATQVVIRLIRKWTWGLGHRGGRVQGAAFRNPHASSHIPRWVNPLILTVIFFTIPLTLGNYWDGIGPLFWIFYLLILITGVYVAGRMDFHVFAGTVIIAWIVGNPSEYLGSVSSGIWSFTYNPNYPPFFLLFACWPLEILAQFGLSAFLADEPLDSYTS